MNNTIGERAQKSLEFKEMLERRTGLEVIMWDELSDNSRSQSYFNGSQCAQRTASSIWISWLLFLFCRDIWIPCPVREINKMEKIKFQLEDGTEAEFYVEEQTRIGGVAYLLVSDSQDDEATAYIFKDVSEDDSQKPAMKWSRTRMRCRLFLKYLNKC